MAEGVVLWGCVVDLGLIGLLGPFGLLGLMGLLGFMGLLGHLGIAGSRLRGTLEMLALAGDSPKP